MSGAFHGFVGNSAAMRAVYSLIETFGPAPIPVLITGPTGTGKELAANALHEIGSGRRRMVTANCAAYAESLIDSELFGHKRGAFTGAVRDHKGIIERADGGTLFLDEIGELPLFSQAKLLRAVETGVFTQVGGERVRRSSFRLLAATNRDLERLVAEGEFREDLRHRLGSAVIRLPPLADRPDDIPELVSFFLERYRRQTDRAPIRLTPRALASLMAARWPGNVRQLRHVVETAATIAKGTSVTAEDVQMVLPVASTDPGEVPVPTLEEARGRADVEAAQLALRATGGSRRRAAELLDVSEATLYRILRDLESAPNGGDVSQN